jgi:hypothetical protein
MHNSMYVYSMHGMACSTCMHIIDWGVLLQCMHANIRNACQTIDDNCMALRTVDHGHEYIYIYIYIYTYYIYAHKHACVQIE